MTPKNEKNQLKQNIKELTEIANWFDSQKEIDLEEGIEKVKQAAVIIKASKARLREIENEFEEIKREAQAEG